MSFFFFNDTATTEIDTLSLHDALPISLQLVLDQGAWEEVLTVHPDDADVLQDLLRHQEDVHYDVGRRVLMFGTTPVGRSEEHTSELQSRQYLVCRLLLEKKKKRMQLSC